MRVHSEGAQTECAAEVICADRKSHAMGHYMARYMWLRGTHVRVVCHTEETSVRHKWRVNYYVTAVNGMHFYGRAKHAKWGQVEVRRHLARRVIVLSKRVYASGADIRHQETY